MEIAFVLGVVAVALGGIWLTSRSVSDNNYYNNKAQGMLVVVENIRTLYKGQDTTGYIRLDNTTAGFKLGLFKGTQFSQSPTLLMSGATYIMDERGYAMALRIDNNNIVFDYRFQSLEDCINITAALTRNAAAQLQRVYVAGTYYFSFPFIPTAAQCANWATQGGNAFFKF